MSNDFELPQKVETKGQTFSEKAIKEDVQTTDVSKPEKPRYEESELSKIFDDIIFSGVYSEEITIKGRLKITLRTRTAEETEKISGKLDSNPINLITTLNEKRALLTLYYALSKYQGRDLGMLKQEDREKFINAIPAPVISSIITALSKFDTKVYAACADGEENF